MKLVICGVIGVCSLIGAGAASADDFFGTPSRNIVCQIGPQQAGHTASCVVLSETTLRGGQKIWAMNRTGKVKVFRSLSNAAVEVPTLDYGKTYRGHGIRCISRKRGLTCRNQSDHGFFLSKQRQRVF